MAKSGGNMIWDIVNNIRVFGWLWVISLFRSVSWNQDINFKNNGFDIISLKKNRGYLTGTWFERCKFLSQYLKE